MKLLALVSDLVFNALSDGTIHFAMKGPQKSDFKTITYKSGM